MPQVKLDDGIFGAAQRRAAENGYASVDDFVSDVLTQTLADDSENFDHLFTAERRAELERISAEIRSGAKSYSMSEVDDYLQNKRDAWLAKHAS